MINDGWKAGWTIDGVDQDSKYDDEEKKYVYDYPRPSVTTDVVVFLKRINKETEVLLIKRGDKTEACSGMWALPGGYMEINETTKETAIRELFEETDIKFCPSELKLVDIYDATDRDTRGRVITVAYSVITPFKPTVSIKEEFRHEISDYKWVKILTTIANTDLELAFDHRRIILDAYFGIEWN